MGLLIRMALYGLFAGTAGYGLATFDAEAGTITIQVEPLVQMIGGIAGYLGTFWASRVVKKNGGKT